jgi:hypothetical protein
LVPFHAEPTGALMKSKDFVIEKRRKKSARFAYGGYWYPGFAHSGDSTGDGDGGESVHEGGWDTTATQNTVITPAVVKASLGVVQQFVRDFNAWLEPQGQGPVQMGRPTGSSAYHAQDAKDDPDKVYGDVDLQMIAPPVEGLTYGQFTSFWNRLADEFVKENNPAYVLQTESKPGHPILAIGDNAYVQVDFMWHEPGMSKWGATRVTPERGTKGLLAGNMWSVFGELLDMSIQHAGVQLKVIDNERVPFSKQKDTQIVTVTTNPETFMLDTFRYLAQQQGIQKPRMVPALKTYGGVRIEQVSIENMVKGVKAFAASAEANGMFGQGDLKPFASADDFLNKFLQRYQEKAMIDVQGKKRDKAQTPAAVARAESDKQKILQGLEKVQGYFR